MFHSFLLTFLYVSHSVSLATFYKSNDRKCLVEPCVEERKFEHFHSEGHISLLEYVSVTFDNKIDSFGIKYS